MILNKTFKLNTRVFNKVIYIFSLLVILSCDETPPYVNIISPVENTVMPSEISTIIAEAYDNDGDGKVVSVDFYVDGIYIGTDNHSNNDNLWEYPWNVSYWADSSEHLITAKATDYSNNIGQSNIVTVMVPSGIEILPALYQPELQEEIDYTNRPTFSWFGLNSTIKYEIEIAYFNDIDEYYNFENYIEEHIEFQNENKFDTIITDTSFTFPYPLTEETKGFYWHIRGENESGNLSDWSDTWVFKIAGPEPPFLDSPTNPNEPVSSLPIFSWVNVGSSASKYHIKVSGVNENCVDTGNLDNCFLGNEILDDDDIDRVVGSIQYYTPNQGLAILSGLHWWKVRSKNDNDIWGDWSEVKSFIMSEPTAPELVSPLNGEKIDFTDQPELNWDSNEASIKHRIQISTDTGASFEDSIYLDFDTFYANQINLDTTLYSLKYGTNYWRVKSANNADAWSQWSSVNQFRITGTSPPNIISPHQDSIFTQYDSLLFAWEASLDANNNPASMYHIQINYNEIEGIQRDVEIDGDDQLQYLFSDVSFLNDESYYRIRSRNHIGFWGDWSSCQFDELSQPFGCDDIKDYVRFYDQPASPLLISPSEVDLLYQEPFIWQSVFGSDQYKIQLSNNQSFDNLIIDEVVLNNEYNTESFNFESYSATTLYWRVQSIVNTVGNDLLSNWSEIKEFSAVEPSVPTLEFPIEGVIINENLEFAWSDVDGAQNHQIIVSDNYNFNSSGTIINTFTSESSLNEFNFLNDVQNENYFWKVRTKSELGIWSEYSDDAGAFFTLENPPVPELSFPNNLSLMTKVDTLKWSSPIELTEYEIEIVNQNSGQIFSYNSISTEIVIDSNLLNGGTHSWKVRSKNNIGMWSDWSEIWSFWVPFELEIDYYNFQNLSMSVYPITTEQYIDFLNEAYHDPLEYVAIRGQYIKGFCEGMPEGEEQIFVKRATASDIYPYNLAKIRWNDTEELFYFEGTNDLIYDNHPVVFVSWCGAIAFANHYNLDLPTSGEWENAINESGWDVSYDSLYINYNGSGDPWDIPGGTTPVNFYQNPSSNLRDAFGNVWEWTNDINGSDRECMGSSYLNLLQQISPDSIRIVLNGSNSVNKDIGFRIIKKLSD